MKIRRREFLKTTVLAGIGMMVYNPLLNAFAARVDRRPVLRQDGWYPSTCQGCTTWCPIEIFIQNGRAVKVRGNQYSLVNPGFCCPRGHLIPKMVYDPDRVKVPMKRTNPVKGKGVDPGFVPVSWDEAMDMIADKIIELRSNGEPHKLMLMRGRYTANNELLYSVFPKIIGSPNNLSHSSICAEAEKMGCYYTEGFWGYRDYDLENTKYLVLWGVDPFRSNRQVPRSMSVLKNIQGNATIATIDPFFTGAAAKSDVWLPVKPGEDGALAVAMAHHIMVKGIWNRDFVGDFNGNGVNAFIANQLVNENDFTENETLGIIKWWNIELKDKTTEWASAITGIPKEKIEKVAEEMASQAPNVSIWYGPGPTMSPRGSYAAMAIYALNGLMGSIDNYGGPVTTVSTKSNAIPAHANYLDEIATTGNSKKKIDQRGTLAFPALASGKSGGGVVLNNVPNAMLAANPYEIKMAICYWGNFNFSGTEPERWNQALANLPFFVHITTHAAEMSQFADLVLPAKFHATERFAYVKTNGNLHSEVSIQMPLTGNYFDAKADETEIPFMIAQKLADKGFSNLLDYYRNELKDPISGAMADTPEEFALYSTRYFTKPSWDLLSGGWDEFVEKGVKSFGPYEFKKKWGGNFKTVSKYFEFYSLTLKQALEEHATKHSVSVDDVLQTCNYEARGEQAFVPHYEKPYRWGTFEEYPFTLIDLKSRFNREGRSANHPYVQMFKNLDMMDVNWEDCVKLNPADAAKLNVADGSLVRVTTLTGSFILKARLWEGVMPGTVGKTFGMGHWAYGRFASDYANFQPKGINNNDLMKDDYDRLSGSTCRNGGFVGVRIERV
jgi:anaerobic selenocysteine-containing dehydrogenase